MESAAKGAAELSGEPVNRLGPYSHKNMRNTNNNTSNNNRQQQSATSGRQTTLRPITCFNCGETVTTPIKNHVRRECSAIGKTCSKCNNKGHLAQYCKKHPGVNQIQQQATPPTPNPAAAAPMAEEEETYNINIFQIETIDPSTNSSSHENNAYNGNTQHINRGGC